MDSLLVDLAKAQDIANGGIPQDFLWPEDALVAVASAAVRAHVFGLTAIGEADLAWATEAVMLAAENPRRDDMSHHSTMFPTGADRLAGLAAPLLLLSPFDSLGLGRDRLEGCLHALASSLYDEVRINYAKGCEPIWTSSCSSAPSSDRCTRHWPAWDAAVTTLADCRVEPWTQEGERKTVEPLSPPFQDALLSVRSEHPVGEPPPNAGGMYGRCKGIGMREGQRC